MTRVHITGGCFDVRETIIRAHLSSLMADAAAERRAHAGGDPAESRRGLRRQVGLALVRIGRALADEPTGSPAHSA